MAKRDSEEKVVVLHSPALRKFTKHVINAAMRQKLREEKIKEIEKDIDTDRILSKHAKKERVIGNIDRLKKEIQHLASQEKRVLELQQREFLEHDQLDNRIKHLEEELDALSHIAFLNAKGNREEMERLRKENVDVISGRLKKASQEEIESLRKELKINEQDMKKLQSKMEELDRKKRPDTVSSKIVDIVSPQTPTTIAAAEGRARKKAKIKRLSKKLKPTAKKKNIAVKKKNPKAKKPSHLKVKITTRSKPARKTPKAKKISKKEISAIEKQIRAAEKLHKELQKRKHPKKDLARLKKVIDSHKKKLKSLKK